MGRVDPPSSQTRSYQPAQFLRLSVPANWEPASGSDGGVTYAPAGGFVQGGSFTHGIQLGTARSTTGNLQRDTEQLLQGFAKSNPNLRRSGAAQRERIGGRDGITTALTNVSDATGQAEASPSPRWHCATTPCCSSSVWRREAEAGTYTRRFGA